MKIGLFFGSFNPIHVGHLIIATHVLNYTTLKKVWFVVSPQNPLKNSNTLLNEWSRLHLVQLAIENDKNLKVCDAELHLPRPSFTIDTISYLKEKSPIHEFSVIMGSDSFQNLENWKNYKNLIKENEIIIYERQGFPVKVVQQMEQIVLKNVPLLQISASFIRQAIKDGKSIKYLVPEEVLEEIEKGRYYK
jgi:nicotinate-nucleotide adenylyltransferase